MNTYRVTEDWPTFKQFILDKLKNVDEEAIGIMHKDKEIIIRSYDESILNIIKSHYTLTPCEQPGNYLDEDGKWWYFGNDKLFDLKI